MDKYLSEEVYNRLCACTSRRSDMMELVNAKWRDMQDKGKDKKGFVREDALVQIWELMSENGRDFDLTVDEYNELLKG